MPPQTPLAVAVLQRFLPDDEPLAGDLLEQFTARRSRVWLWRQVFLAILIRSWRHADEIRPLKLLDAEHSRPRVNPAVRWTTINISGSPIAGVGGLGLLALGLLVATVRPRAWWIVVPGVLGGLVLGAVMVLVQRHRAP